MELRESILEGTLKAFNQKGLKFTMDDLAGILGMSKKTIYTVFRDKESLFLAMVDYLFDSIKESERQGLENEKLSTLEKIRAVLGVLPESYREVDFRQLYLLREKYPNIYKHMQEFDYMRSNVSYARGKTWFIPSSWHNEKSLYVRQDWIDNLNNKPDL